MRNKISSVEYNVIKKATLLYHQSLATNSDKIVQVKEIFGINEESIKVYQIGYCDGSNKNLYPDNLEILKKLKKTSFISAKGKELFTGCITIPVYNEKDQLAEIIGLPLKTGRIKKQYIKVLKDNSFLNRQSFKIHKRIFVTYNIPLFFEAIQKGIKNIIPIVTNFISDSQIRVLRESGIDKMFFTFECNDKTLIERLKQTNISLYNLPISSFSGIKAKELNNLYKEAKPVFKKDNKIISNKKSGRLLKQTTDMNLNFLKENTGF